MKKRNKFLRRAVFLILALLLMSPLLSVNAKSTSKKTTDQILYVAGEEYGYPIEYYDFADKKFKGAMPDLLEKISEKTGITFEYVSFGNDETLIKNLQVDLISYHQIEESEENTKLTYSPVCFELLLNGTQQYCLAYTMALDKETAEKINQALTEIGANEKEQILLYNIAEGKDNYKDKIFDLILIVFLVIFVVLTIIFFVAYRKYKKRLQQWRFKDHVTGYENIILFETNFTGFINDQNRGSYCLISLSLEHFNQWEEENSFVESSSILKVISGIIQKNLREEEFFSRVIGGNFVLLMQYVSKQNFPEQLTKEIIEKIEKKLSSDEKYEGLKPRAGVYFLGVNDITLNESLHCARMAKKWGKENDRSVAVFDVIYEEKVMEDRELERGVETSIENGEFVPYFHPNIDVETSEVVNYEVLSRWQHPDRGLLFPGQFIPILKRKNLLSKMDLGLFQTVCTLLEEQNKTEGKKMYVSFNFSPESLRIPQFGQKLHEIVTQHQLSAQYMGIDITESITAQNKKEIVERISELKSFGFSVTLDNFGGEYSSFVDLQTYDIDYVKLDRILLNDLEQEKTRLVIKGIVDLCHNIGVKVIGEGIESKEQLNLLKQVNCDAAQGFYFCQPMPFSEL